MSNIVSSLEGYTGIFIVLLMILVLVLLAVVFSLSLGLSRLNRKYNRFMRGKDAQSLEQILLKKVAEIDRLVDSDYTHTEELKRLRTSIKKSLSKYAIIKYDAFEDMGGKLSFALAMIDQDNTGFILNAIHSRENCFLYIKEIVKGESYIMLSNEEINALKQAVNFGITNKTE